MNKQELIDFEKEISEIYETGQIKGPIHLRDGNEDFLVEYFDENFTGGDYVFATWANHEEVLLSGVPKEKVKERILKGESWSFSLSVS